MGHELSAEFHQVTAYCLEFFVWRVAEVDNHHGGFVFDQQVVGTQPIDEFLSDDELGAGLLQFVPQAQPCGELPAPALLRSKEQHPVTTQDAERRVDISRGGRKVVARLTRLSASTRFMSGVAAAVPDAGMTEVDERLVVVDGFDNVVEMDRDVPDLRNDHACHRDTR